MKRIGNRVGILFAEAVCVVLLITFTGCRHNADMRHLPVIHITTDSKIPWEGKVSCAVTVVTGTDSTVWDGKIKFRGGVSAKYYKHSYSLKFNEKHSLCDLPSNRSWILNASYIDKTFMRHKLCYDLFNMMGDYDLAPLCAYALVRENGDPKGLYVIMQRLNKQSLHLNPKDTAAVIFKEPKIFYSNDQLPSPTLFDENYQGQAYPDYDKGDRSYLMDDLRTFITQTPDQDFYVKVGEVFDLQNIIDWHLLLLFTNGGDGVKKNFYLYRKDSQSPYRIALWDCDHSFGRDGDNEKNMLERLLDDRQNILLDRLLKSTDYQQALKKRYHELRDSGIFSYENIEKMMRENDKWIRLGLDENTMLWPFDSEDYFDSAGYDEEYALILEFVKKSIERMDTLMR